MQGKRLIYIILAILLTSNSLAFVMPEYYKGVSVKIYDNTSVNKEDVLSLIDDLGDYKKGIELIKVTKNDRFHPDWCAMFELPNVINIFCVDKDSIVHELAHGKQLEMGDPIHKALSHNGFFCYYYAKIWNDIYGSTYDMKHEFNYMIYCGTKDINVPLNDYCQIVNYSDIEICKEISKSERT